MDWTNVLETFIGASLAFVFSWILQRQLIKRTEDFQKAMQARMENLQTTFEIDRRAFDDKLAKEREYFDHIHSKRSP